MCRFVRVWSYGGLPLLQDTVEVDNNVTRNLDTELPRDDWDVLILHYLVVSHVRAGYLSIFFVMAFFAMLIVLVHQDWMRKHRRTILIGTAVLVLCALVIRPGSVLLESFLPRFDLEEPTIKIRVHIWKQALEIIEDYPVLGVGLGNYEVIAWKYLDQTAADMTRQSNTRIDRTHNEYLNLACELGLVGLFMFLAFLGLLAAKTVIWLERNSGREEFWVVAALTAGLLGGLVDAMFTFPFQMPGSIHQFFLTAGVLSGLVAQSDMRVRASVLPSRELLYTAIWPTHLHIPRRMMCSSRSAIRCQASLWPPSTRAWRPWWDVAWRASSPTVTAPHATTGAPIRTITFAAWYAVVSSTFPAICLRKNWMIFARTPMALGSPGTAWN